MPESTNRFAPSRITDYSKSGIIAEIRRVILEECGGVVPARDVFESLSRVSRVTIAKRFGTYSEGIRKAGFPLHIDTSHPRFTAEQVRSNLLEVLERAKGYCFTQAFYRENGGLCGVEVVKTRLGVKNWQGVMETIGAQRKQRILHTVVSSLAQRRNLLASVTEGDLFKEIDRVWQARGRRPTYSEFIQASKLGIRVYETRYGSWTKAIDAFCKANQILVQGRARTRPTEDILLAELRSVQIKQPGAILTHDSYKANGGTYSRSVFAARFGSWTQAVNRAGSISGEQGRHARTELFDEIQRLWEQFGRQPTQVQMWKQGNISPKCYARVFGTWTKAIHAFCRDRNDHHATSAIPEPVSHDRDASEQVALQSSVEIPSEKTTPLVIEHRTGRTVSYKLRFQVLKRDHFRCNACGRSPANHPGLELQVDHVIAYSSGGETEMDNLQTLCKACNLGKSNL